MKHNILFAALSALMLFSSCSSDLLEVESETAVTSDYLYNNEEGLEKALVALYNLDRAFFASASDNCLGTVILLDAVTDLVTFRGGNCGAIFRLQGNTASTSLFLDYWKHFYTMIGKANEVIAAAELIGLDDPDVARIYGEACLHRARAYFYLYQRFERLYLNTEPTSVDNAFGRTFPASGKADIFALIKADLAKAEQYLDWEPRTGSAGTPEYGRFTKAVAKHVRAQVAMWEEDWDTAIRQCEELIGNGTYRLMDDPAAPFLAADLNFSENLFVLQFSDQPGGGGTVSGGTVSGHAFSAITTAAYGSLRGCKWTAEDGGYGYGRIYPNTYLLSLFDAERDTRYSKLFRFEYYYNDPDNLPAGKNLGDVVTGTASQYMTNLHPATLKYRDNWTIADEPARTSSFKDIVVYRLAETYLMCAEAYFHKGGSSADALRYFNVTYTRAGNEPKTAIDMEDILAEYARECYFEGVRWPLLKRLGLLEERVKLHAGDSRSEDPNLNRDYIEARNAFEKKHWTWPIPQTELDLMPGFGQNEGWE